MVVDTNILIHASNRDDPLHAPCRAWLDACRAGTDAWFLTWGIVYEFIRVVSHPGVLEHPCKASDAWRFVEALRPSPGLQFLVETERHARLLGSLLDSMPNLAGNVLHDVHTATLMREHGIRRIATRDMGFHRFDFLEPFDPVP